MSGIWDTPKPEWMLCPICWERVNRKGYDAELLARLDRDEPGAAEQVHDEHVEEEVLFAAQNREFAETEARWEKRKQLSELVYGPGPITDPVTAEVLAYEMDEEWEIDRGAEQVARWMEAARRKDDPYS